MDVIICTNTALEHAQNSDHSTDSGWAQLTPGWKHLETGHSKFPPSLSNQMAGLPHAC